MYKYITELLVAPWDGPRFSVQGCSARGCYRVPTLSPVYLGSPAFRSRHSFFYCSALFCFLRIGKFTLRCHGLCGMIRSRVRGSLPPQSLVPFCTERRLLPFQVLFPLCGFHKQCDGVGGRVAAERSAACHQVQHFVYPREQRPYGSAEPAPI